MNVPPNVEVRAAIQITNMSEETKKAPRIRAAEHGRSAEAKLAAILDEAARGKESLKLGSALVALFGPDDGVDLDTAPPPHRHSI